LRIEEIRRRRKELVDEKELLFFFENRHQWEDKALQRRTLEEHIGILKKKGTITFVFTLNIKIMSKKLSLAILFYNYKHERIL
jgi:hypothetical protein